MVFFPSSDFLNNTSPVGVIAAVFQHFVMNGFVNVINNFGPGLRVMYNISIICITNNCSVQYYNIELHFYSISDVILISINAHIRII